MVAVLENYEKRSLAHPSWLVCQFRADTEMVTRCQASAEGEERFWRGQAIGTIRDLWPWQDMKILAQEQARLFVGYMRQQYQQYELVGAESEMELWGPYLQKVDWNRVQDRLVRGDLDGFGEELKKSEYAPGWAYGFDDKPEDKGLVFLIRGLFLAKFGRLVEDKEVLLV